MWSINVALLQVNVILKYQINIFLILKYYLLQQYYLHFWLASKLSVSKSVCEN